MNVKPANTIAIQMLHARTLRAHGYAVAQAGLLEVAPFAQVRFHA